MSDTTVENRGLLGRLSQAGWVEPFLGALVAIYGIMAAYAAYQAGIFGGNSAEQYFIGLSDLSDGNSASSEASQQYAEDNNYFVQLEMQSVLIDDPEKFDEVYETLVGNLSDAALESLDQETFEFDSDGYQDALYADAYLLWENSDNAFEAAQAWDEIGDNYDLLVLYLALGLGFAAWASLMSPSGITRYLFGLLAVILLVVSIMTLVRLESTPRPAQYKSCWNTPECLGGEVEE